MPICQRRKTLLPKHKFMVKICLISSPKVKIIQRSWMSYRPIVIQSYAKYGLTMSKDKKLWPEHEVMSKILQIAVEIKVNVVSTNVKWYANVKANIYYGSDRKTYQNPCNFDLEAKIQRRIEIMDVRHISSDGGTPKCQMWYANVKAKKRYGPDTNLHRQTGRQTERQTKGQTEWFLFSTLNFGYGQYDKKCLRNIIIRAQFSEI